MRYVSTILFSLVLAVGLAGCDSNDNGGPGPTAEVRFMHASPDAGAVSVLVDGEEVRSDVSFSGTITSPAVTEYLDVPVSADAEIAVQDASGNTVLSTTAGSANLQEDNQYTVIVAGATTADNSPQAIVLRDQFRDDLGESQIGLRLVHGAATLETPVDIYLNQPGTDLAQDELVTQNFQFGNDFPGGFRGQFAARGLSSEGSELVVTPTGSTQAVLTLEIGTGPESLQIRPGQHVTGVAIDAPGSQAPAGALIQVDSPGS
jgi:hypothetical protein